MAKEIGETEMPQDGLPGEIPKAGEFYRHFKGNLYQVIGVAYDAGTLEPTVVYRALDGQGRWYVRALAEFLSPVDREKYPDHPAAYRFERVEPEGVFGTGNVRPAAEMPDKNDLARVFDIKRAKNIPMREIKKDVQEPGQPLQQTAEKTEMRAETGSEPEWSNPEAEKVRPELLRFLDAETPGEKLAVLRQIRGKLDEELMTNIELSIDLMPDERESLERRLSLVEKNLEKRVRYEGTRLR